MVQDIRDRVVQRSLLDVLTDVAPVRSRIECDYSYGGLPGIGVPDAIQDACEAIAAGAEYYIRSDIRDFFSNIPRREVLEDLKGILPDDSLDGFLDQATRVELANREQLRPLLHRFPGPAVGVAQGHSLSAFLGNFLLRPFDDRMNEGPCCCLRYLDDFLLLGPDQDTVWSRFHRGNDLLDGWGMTTYHPHHDDKATEGTTRRQFEFLGCAISRDFVHPSRENRRSLIADVEERLEDSKRAMYEGRFRAGPARKRSLVGVLSEIDSVLEAWSKQYRFCNAGDLFAQLDERIDDLIAEFIRTYDAHKDEQGPVVRRRTLGVWSLADTDLDPILPLDD